MAKIDLTVPSLTDDQTSSGSKFIDLRSSMPGDSYNWSWTRPLAQVKYLAIHHSGGSDTQTPEQIANFHINSNGWGGIGYHFLIAQNGTVYYVGDISTARANVANLNEEVLGVCLIGNFINGKQPTVVQLDSTRKLCDFFINHYPALSNLGSWDAVRGHKDLPGQSTICPGDEWSKWRLQIITTAAPTANDSGIIFNDASDRKQKIADVYRAVLGTEPDPASLQLHHESSQTIDQIRKLVVDSHAHQNVLDQAKQTTDLQSQMAKLQDVVNDQKSQIQSLNITVASLTEQLDLLNDQIDQKQPTLLPIEKPQDTTFTLIDSLFNLYQFFFPVQEGTKS